MAHTDASGAYTLSLPAGTYDVTVEAFGYATVTTAKVTIADGGRPDQELRTAHGAQPDDHGHGHRRFRARLAALRQDHRGRRRPAAPSGPTPRPAPTASPSRRTVTYTLHITATIPGYREVVRQLPEGTTAQKLDIPVPADVWSAGGPAYAPELTGPTEEFTSTALPAAGLDGRQRRRNTGRLGVRRPGRTPGNTTGGDGGFAVVDSDHYGYPAAQDSSLISPPYDFTDATVPELAFDTDLVPFFGQRARRRRQHRRRQRPGRTSGP